MKGRARCKAIGLKAMNWDGAAMPLLTTFGMLAAFAWTLLRFG